MSEAPKSAWDRAEEMADSYSKGTYLRLKDDGDKFTGMFVGEPLPFEQCYDPEKKRYLPATDENKAKYGKPSLKFDLSVVDRDGEDGDYSYTARIFEANVKTFKLLLECKRKYGLDRLFEVTRNGKANDTKTTYSILPEDAPSAELLSELKAIEPLDLQAERDRNSERNEEDDSKEFKKSDKKPEKKTEKKPEKKEEPKAAPKEEPKPAPAKEEPKAAEKTEKAPAPAATPVAQAAAPATDGACIEAKVANLIGTTIKELPDMKTAIDKFLKFFEVKKIKDVPAARQTEAIEYVEKLCKEQGISKEPAPEEDPFG